MNKKNSLLIKRMVGIAVLLALVVVLQLFSGNIKFGEISITLALVPIAMGAILYGPVAGLGLGAVMGIIIFFDPGTQKVFWPVNIPATLVICVLKSGLAGLASGFIFKLFAFIANKTEKKMLFYIIGIVVAALIVPVVNTALFAVGAAIFFQDVFGGGLGVIITAVITTNFLVEILVSAALSPALVTLVKVLSSRYNLGFTNDFSVFNTLLPKDLDVEEVTE